MLCERRRLVGVLRDTLMLRKTWSWEIGFDRKMWHRQGNFSDDVELATIMRSMTAACTYGWALCQLALEVGPSLRYRRGLLSSFPSLSLVCQCVYGTLESMLERLRQDLYTDCGLFRSVPQRAGLRLLLNHVQVFVCQCLGRSR